MIVTAVERQRRRRRVAVFVDGHFALALSVELAAQHDLRPGRAVTADELASIADAEALRSAKQSALRLLGYRPRSERELSERLARKGFQSAVVEETLARMRELGYLDDDAFARFWTETRQALRPRSRRLLASELRGRGVAQEAAEQATAAISDEEAAYQAAAKRLPALRGLAYARFRERLGRFLSSRGFSYDVAQHTIQRCWAEVDEESDPAR